MEINEKAALHGMRELFVSIVKTQLLVEEALRQLSWTETIKTDT